MADVLEDRRDLVAHGTIEKTVDEMIEEYVGSLGVSQILHAFLVSLSWVFDAQNTLITIFTDHRPEFRCLSGGNRFPCSRNVSLCKISPAGWEWVGGKKSSVIAEWGLICNKKFMAGVPSSMFFLGALLGSALHGKLADRFLGRKRTLMMCCLLTAITSFLTSLSPNLWIYALLRFSNGFSRSGIGICCLVLATEIVGRKWRAQVGQYGFIFFTLGFFSLPFIAFVTKSSWRHFYAIISIFPLFYSLAVLPFVSESPRWLAVRGKTKEALDVLKKLARINGKDFPTNVVIKDAFPRKDTTENRKEESLWSSKSAKRRLILTMVAGLGIGLVYYGVQLNLENMKFNLYMTVALNALMEIPVIFIGSLLLAYMNRRKVFATTACITGFSCFLCALLADTKMGKTSTWIQLAAETVGFMAISAAFDILLIYSVELFPTNVRNFCVSLLGQALMLGAALSPLVVVLGRLNPALSFLVFGGFSILSAIQTIWLPETRNSLLHETLEQLENEMEKKTRNPHEMQSTNV